MAAIDLHVGERKGDHVRIRVLARTEQAARDYWDANWLHCEVSVRAGGWKGTNGEAYFRTEEISRLRAKVELLRDRKLADADFAPMEPHVRLRLEVGEDARTLVVSGSATDRLEGGNRLEFRFVAPFGALESLAARLRAVESTYPTIGKG